MLLFSKRRAKVVTEYFLLNISCCTRNAGGGYMLVSLSFWLQKHIRKKQIILLIASYVAIVAVMGLLIIPAILKNAGGMNIFDLKAAGYDLNYANTFIAAIGAKGREVYLFAQLPLDMIFPVVYGLIYMALADKVFKKISVTMFAAIMVLSVSDYAENISVYMMLLSGKLSASLVAAASIFTVTKTVFLYLTVLSIALGALNGCIQKNEALNNFCRRSFD
jgi:hypothetical protein